jgi:P27 family predicted phage terminase small subunit
MNRNPRAPQHLRPETRSWWSSVLRDFALEEHHHKLLLLACEAFDRCAEAREILTRDGLTIPTGDGGMKAHPAVAIERDSRLGFARLLRELDLDIEMPSEGRRPPGLRSNRRP